MVRERHPKMWLVQSLNINKHIDKLPTVYISTILLILSMLLVGLDDIYMSIWAELFVDVSFGHEIVGGTFSRTDGCKTSYSDILKAFYGRVTLAILKGNFVFLAFKLQFYSCGFVCFCSQPSPKHKVRQINETKLDEVTYNYHIWGIFASPNYLQSTQKHFAYSF